MNFLNMFEMGGFFQFFFMGRSTGIPIQTNFFCGEFKVN